MTSDLLMQDLLGAAGETTTFGLLRLGEVDIALPLGALREAASCPKSFVPFPAASPALLGAMALRDQVVPVLDVGVLLGIPGAEADEAVVVIVGDGEHIVGLRVDATNGVCQVANERIQRVRLLAPGLTSDTFQQSDGRVTHVLDPKAMINAEGVPSVPALSESSESERYAAMRSKRRLTLLKCGEYVLALNVVDVHTTLPGSTAAASPLRSGYCRGVTTFRDLEVAVVDPLMLLGLGSLSSATAGAQIVVELPKGFVVFVVDSLLEIVDIDETEVLPVPEASIARPDLVSSVVNLDGHGICFVLDIEGFRSEENLISLSSVNLPIAEAQSNELPESQSLSKVDEDSVRKGPAFISYTADAHIATPLDHVDEIIPFPAEITNTDVGRANLGLIVHREIAVPLICLRTVLGLDPSGDRGACLLVSTDAGQVAFVVDCLRVVDNEYWRDKQSAATNFGTLLGECDLVQIGEDTTLLPDLDLKSLAEKQLARLG